MAWKGASQSGNRRGTESGFNTEATEKDEATEAAERTAVRELHVWLR